jgi:hypothetical protein
MGDITVVALIAGSFALIMWCTVVVVYKVGKFLHSKRKPKLTLIKGEKEDKGPYGKSR